MPARKRSRPTLRERGLKKSIVDRVLERKATFDDDGRYVEWEWADHQEGERFRRCDQLSRERTEMRSHVIQEEP